MTMEILRRIRERAYHFWEQEGRPEGRHLDHWLQAEQELVAENAMDFEFKQLMRAYRSGIVSETTVEQVMTELEKWTLSNGMGSSARRRNLVD
jgi:Iap family predicted aminopeptidase